MTASGSGDEMKPQAWTWSRTHFSPTKLLVTTLVTSPCAGVSLVSLSRKAREKHSADAPVLTRLSCSHHRLSAQSRDQHSTVAGPGSARCGTLTAAGGGGRGAAYLGLSHSCPVCCTGTTRQHSNQFLNRQHFFPQPALLGQSQRSQLEQLSTNVTTFLLNSLSFFSLFWVVTVSECVVSGRAGQAGSDSHGGRGVLTGEARLPGPAQHQVSSRGQLITPTQCRHYSHCLDS